MKIKVATPQCGEEEAAAVRDVLLSGNYVSGAIVREFEERFADYIGVRHAVAVNSGTAAIHAALAALDIGPGDEVIVPALTFFSTITAVIHQGAVPILADISRDNYCLDPADAARRITLRTKAIMPVHFFGHAADMDGIRQVTGDAGLYVIEDAAQSHGTSIGGHVTGSIGDMGAFSLFATKHMTTGEGGIVTTDNGDHAEMMRSFRSHGMRGRDEHVLLGYNYRMTEIAAAIGLKQLTKLDRLNAGRIRVSEALIERLSDIPWLTLPKVRAIVRHTYFWCHAEIDEQRLGMTTAELIARLFEAGIEVRNRYKAPLNEQPLLTSNIPPILKLSAGDHLPDYGSMSFPVAKSVAGHIIGLPNRPDMTEEEIDYVSDVIRTIGRN